MIKRERILSLDVGATKINFGLVNLRGKIFYSRRVKTNNKYGKFGFLKQLKKIIKESISPDVSAIGFGFAGPVDPLTGNVLEAPNFPGSWSNFPLKKIVSSWVKIPVFIENDASCFTLAESVFGSAKNYNPVVGLTIGTGLGGGIVINKNIYHGVLSGAELGHMKITEKGFKCSCKKNGHLESQVSGPAMLKYYKMFTKQTKSTYEVADLAKKGDKQAKRVIKTMAKYLGIGLANIGNILNPEIIIIGGGLSQIKSILPLALKTMKKELAYPQQKKIKVLESKMKNRAMLLGAALITQRKYRNQI
jgi:glucokinase